MENFNEFKKKLFYNIEKISFVSKYRERDVLTDMLSIMFYLSHFKVIDKRVITEEYSTKKLLETMNKYEENILQEIQSSIALIEDFASKNPYTDIFGPIIMDIKASKEKQTDGQFYTPQTISDFIAMATINSETSAEEHIKEDFMKGKLRSFSDPSCGSGVMMVSTAKYWNKSFPDYPFELCCYVDVADVDFLAILASGCNFVLNKIPAILRHQDSLTNKEYSGTYVNIHFINTVNLAEERKSIYKKISALNEVLKK